MKCTALFTLLLAAVTVSASPTTDTSSKSTSNTVVPPISGINSTFHDEGRKIVRRTGIEHVFCYNSGNTINRAWAVQVIDLFCSSIMDKTFTPGSLSTHTYTFQGSSTTMLLSVQAINGCTFSFGATGLIDCGRMLRAPIDKCNTGGENGKQGGQVTDDCAMWRADPGENV